MIDEFAIQQTISRYCDGANRRDWQQVLATFTPDAIWEVPTLGAKLEGHEAIQEGFAAFTGPTDYIVQINAPAIIEVDGDRGTARSVIRECGKYTGRDEAFEVLGFFTDELVRTADGWKFTRRTLQIQGMHTIALVPPGQ